MSRSRDARVAEFLDGAGWGDALVHPLPGDASVRRYARLLHGGDTAILANNSSPGGADEAARFVKVAGWLSAKGYSVPRILADCAEGGLLLQEDFGPMQAAQAIAADPSLEEPIYRAATALLADLARYPAPDFATPLDAGGLSSLLDVVEDWLAPLVGASPSAALASLAPWIGARYARLDDRPPVLSLRDFHAENLVWLPERRGIARVGLLDFQDAVATHPVYDLVSLMQDARRDTSPGLASRCKAGHARAIGMDRQHHDEMFALLGAQRALRILGVFARLALRDHKARYLDYVPRVWANLARDLDHPSLGELKEMVRAALPDLTADRVSAVERRCI